MVAEIKLFYFVYQISGLMFPKMSTPRRRFYRHRITSTRRYSNAVKMVEIDLEESPVLIAGLKMVNVFPYLILYNQGNIILREVG